MALSVNILMTKCWSRLEAGLDVRVKRKLVDGGNDGCSLVLFAQRVVVIREGLISRQSGGNESSSPDRSELGTKRFHQSTEPARFESHNASIRPLS